MTTPILSSRIRLTGPTTLYVTTTGTEAGPGTTVPTAFGSIQQATDYVNLNYDLAGQVLTISVADGTYGKSLVTGPFLGARAPNSVLILGNVATPTNCVQAGDSFGVAVNGQAQCYVRGLKFTASSGDGLLVNDPGTHVFYDTVDFGACLNAQVNCNVLAKIKTAGPYSISGGGAQHILAEGWSFYDAESTVTVTISAPVTYTDAFVHARYGGFIDHKRTTWTGYANVTGNRYIVDNEGILHTQGGNGFGNLYFPGTVVPGPSNVSQPACFD